MHRAFPKPVQASHKLRDEEKSVMGAYILCSIRVKITHFNNL